VEIAFTFGALTSSNGISKEELWKCIDICNCDQVFTKAYLHTVHGPSCLGWLYRDTPPPLPCPLPTHPPSPLIPVTPVSTPNPSPFSEVEVEQEVFNYRK